MSWNLARGEDFLPNTSLSELKRLMRAETKAKPRLRLLIAVHRKQGKPLDEIAEACDTPRRTIHGTIQRFQERGVAASNAAEKKGRPPHLSKRQRLRLLKVLEKGNPRAPSRLWTSKEVLALIKKKFGVSYTPQHVWRLLDACGFSLLVPRPRHYKSPGEEVHDAFKKKHSLSRGTIGKKVLLWAARMKPRSDSFPASHAAGLEKGAVPRLP
ncbi:MAG: winged helix-turn-helix domain-containing protein [Candidatus Micrarchaeota archaeon]